MLRDGVEVLVPVERAARRRRVRRPARARRSRPTGSSSRARPRVDASMLTGEPVPVEVCRRRRRRRRDGQRSTAASSSARRGSEPRRRWRRSRGWSTQAQSGKAHVQRLADRVSAVFVPIVIALSLATLAGLARARRRAPRAAFTAAVAVLIIACPCALGLATPTALMVGTGRGAQLGILIEGPEILEQTRRITRSCSTRPARSPRGAWRSPSVAPLNGAPGARRCCGWPARVEDASEHPIAQALVARRRARELGALPAGRALPRPARGRRQRHASRAARSLVGRAGGAARGRLGRRSAAGPPRRSRDRVKPTSAQAVAELRQLGLTPVLLTGDARGGAERGRPRGRDRARRSPRCSRRARPAEISGCRRRARSSRWSATAINDAPALAQADLGLAIGTGTDVAIEATDLTLVSGDLRAAADAIRLARRRLRTIKGNLFWAFAYNIAAIPLAVAGLLNPIVAAAAMAVLEPVRRRQLAPPPPLPEPGRRHVSTSHGYATTRRR